MPQPRLMVVIASTRPGRVGLPVGTWFDGLAREHGSFEVELVDMLELDLPFMDEPNHPRLQQYTKPHTKAWSAKVQAADAFAFVTPEYNFAISAVLKNALDFLHNEWLFKPVGFVHYGGASGGVRAVEMAKQVATTLKMYPVYESVPIPFVARFIDDEGEFQANEAIEKAAGAMLDELLRISTVLAGLRGSS